VKNDKIDAHFNRKRRKKEIVVPSGIRRFVRNNLARTARGSERQLKSDARSMIREGVSDFRPGCYSRHAAELLSYGADYGRAFRNISLQSSNVPFAIIAIDPHVIACFYSPINSEYHTIGFTNVAFS